MPFKRKWKRFGGKKRGRGMFGVVKRAVKRAFARRPSKFRRLSRRISRVRRTLRRVMPQTFRFFVNGFADVTNASAPFFTQLLNAVPISLNSITFPSTSDGLLLAGTATSTYSSMRRGDNVRLQSITVKCMIENTDEILIPAAEYFTKFWVALVWIPEPDNIATASRVDFTSVFNPLFSIGGAALSTQFANDPWWCVWRNGRYVRQFKILRQKRFILQPPSTEAVWVNPAPGVVGFPPGNQLDIGQWMKRWTWKVRLGGRVTQWATGSAPSWAQSDPTFIAKGALSLVWWCDSGVAPHPDFRFISCLKFTNA